MTRAPHATLQAARQRAVAAVVAYLDAVESAVANEVEPSLEACPWPARNTRALVTAGRLEAVKVGRRWFAKPADIRRLLEPSQLAKPASAANDSDGGEDGADRLLRDVLEPRGLRLAEPRTIGRQAAAPRGRAR